MKVVLVNKSDRTGGAAVACRRLLNAINKDGVDVKLLVQEKNDEDLTVEATGTGFWKKKMNFLFFILERLYFLLYEASKEIRFAFSPAIAGENIHKNNLIKNANIVHVHWFNQGFLSLKNLKKLIALNKPIVWTLHDMWAFTGGCHYSGDCENYKVNCGNCPFIKKPSEKDLSYKILKKKKAILKGANIIFVTCSHWLKEKAKESSLLEGFKVVSIPNPIDQKQFYPMDKKRVREKLSLPNNKKLILFAAANVSDKRKGLSYLLKALGLMVKNNSKSVDIEIVTFGKSDDAVFNNLPFEIHNLGVLSEVKKIAEAYNAADLFVLPSLEDNLPNTIMESLACGTPVLAFKTGGIPEMIEHKKNGYLADYKSAADLKKGLDFILNHPQPESLSNNALEKVHKTYNEKVVAKQYLEVYQSIIKKSKQ
ncbi:MAG: glycosyltransferase family 4 protein [Bacteroidota bacterium]